MARYRFHCTNGSDCFFDARGTDIRVPAPLAMRAQQVAREVMRTRVEAADWSGWRVAVCDPKGRRVLVQPFRSDSDDRPAPKSLPFGFPAARWAHQRAFSVPLRLREPLNGAWPCGPVVI